MSIIQRDHPLSLDGVVIDATPDGGYALRILQEFRRKAAMRWEVPDDPNRILYEGLNEEQAKRAAELDAAIAKLEGR